MSCHSGSVARLGRKVHTDSEGPRPKTHMRKRTGSETNMWSKRTGSETRAKHMKLSGFNVVLFDRATKRGNNSVLGLTNLSGSWLISELLL
ncbi:hypothetical protein L1987_23524 [Smallanthus sonchifolius]|uniref:Uncharacterized protein n=1 Tax=Smallanthus sonchifolius TaxID=185202 RepID=A0ACB9IH66_9ASTR|nr:hypothetical protein L1987_23524 [Smallanthus sonchifolius]